jgi:hypothetical protein
LLKQDFTENRSKLEKYREVPEEPNGIPAEEAAGHYQRTEQPY